MESPKPVALNKDLILREQLAIQRTILANQSTFLSFLRTSMYFLIAALSVPKLTSEPLIYEILLYGISFLVVLVGVLNFFKNRQTIKKSLKHIGRYRLEFLELKRIDSGKD